MGVNVGVVYERKVSDSGLSAVRLNPGLTRASRGREGIRRRELRIKQRRASDS